MKWCIRLILVACFIGGLVMYYHEIDRLDRELIFVGGDDD